MKMDKYIFRTKTWHLDEETARQIKKLNNINKYSDEIDVLNSRIDKLDQGLDEQKKNLLVFLGIFTSILTYVSASVGVVAASNLNIVERMVLLLGFGAGLALFLVAVLHIIKNT